MKKIAREFFLPLLLGSVFIFAIETTQVNASNIPSVDYDVVQTSSVVQLADDVFWDKFRESVMKDKNKNKDIDAPEQSSGNEDKPQNDVAESDSEPMSYY